ncbi:LysR family transcriptional regulator [Aquimarina sp. TRL1]|uniref:LysR family transcriptional regulator n=1 Tax=Aquimarina sp. (strain TRL1) TaxID=2736252 RepID=UPI00158AF9DC|nr:LysR family transcriptional regulator [Aquimarina sp. TRL1]QKX05466.1 LysR family transcriptional regulator [Aquimarina sp. TRL1]
MNYTLHQLQIFLKIVEKGSITKASEELHLTQPAVSIQLRNFQDQFPIPLTEVIGRKIYITDFGKEIAEAAQKIIQEVDQISHKTLAYQGQLSGVLKISVVSTGKYIIPYFLSDFMKKHSEVNLVLEVTNKEMVVSSLEENSVDFSLVSVLPKHLKISKTNLMENQLYLVGSTTDTFEKKMYDTSILSELPLIYREPGSGTRHTMEEYLEQNNIVARKQMELTSNEAVKQAVIAGLGYSIMPLIGIRNDLEANRLQIIPVKGFPLKSIWNLISLKNKKFSPVAAAFLSYVEERKDEIIRQKFQLINL